MAKRLLLLGVGLALAGSAHAQTQKSLGVLFSGDASVRGAVLLRAQATEVLSGSQVAAGEGTALLKLERGGQLRICPKTNLSLNAGAIGKALSLGLNAGAMELDYTLDSGADSLITPDFRLLLISPGTFHLAISVSSSGDTCMRSLPGNSASIFVTEMMGSDSYQLAPGKHVLFLKGKIALASPAPEVCGCPESSPPKVEVAEAAPANAPAAESPAAVPAQPAEPQQAASATLPATAAQASAPQAIPGVTRGDEGPAAAPTPAAAAATPGAAAAQPEVAHMEVDSRFSYRGEGEAQDFYTSASRLSISTDNSKLALALLPQIIKPSEPASGPHPAEQTSAKALSKASAPTVAASNSAAPNSAAPNSAAPKSNAAPVPNVATSQSGGGLRRFFRRLFGGH